MSQRVYFIGIGGVSMSGLAEIILAQGRRACGSDRAESEATARLRELGVTVYIGHDGANLRREAENDGVDLVVYTAAVPADNPEIAAAKELGIPVMERADFLGALMKSFKKPVCVAGTHGKTTTTAMVSGILLRAGLDPSVSIGGYVDAIGGNCRAGGSEFFVAEACEYKDSFLRFYPRVGVILNVELDHVDYYPDLASIRASFASFARNIREDGTLVVNAAIDNIEEITRGLKCAVVTYGDGGRVRAENIRFGENGFSEFTVIDDGAEIGVVKLPARGEHNVQNALAAYCAARALGVSQQDALAGLARFDGPKRRFEYKGTTGGLTIIDDYAHHPTEIKATLAAARASAKGKVIVAFQPHTYSRTHELMDGFAESLLGADQTLLIDIYAAREVNTYGVTSAALAEKIRELGGGAVYVGNFENAAEFVAKNYIPNDMLITMGAGDVHLLGERLLSTGL